MDASPRTADRTVTGAERTSPVIAPEALVVLRSPRRLRGTTAIVRRAVPGGWEVEIRSPAGTPMHLTAPANALLLVGEVQDATRR